MSAGRGTVASSANQSRWLPVRRARLASSSMWSILGGAPARGSFQGRAKTVTSNCSWYPAPSAAFARSKRRKTPRPRTSHPAATALSQTALPGQTIATIGTSTAKPTVPATLRLAHRSATSWRYFLALSSFSCAGSFCRAAIPVGGRRGPATSVHRQGGVVSGRGRQAAAFDDATACYPFVGHEPGVGAAARVRRDRHSCTHRLGLVLLVLRAGARVVHPQVGTALRDRAERIKDRRRRGRGEGGGHLVQVGHVGQVVQVGQVGVAGRCRRWCQRPV